MDLQSSEVERVLEEQIPTHHSHSNAGEAGQSGAGSPLLLSEFYLADSSLHDIYLFRDLSETPHNTLTNCNIYKDPVDIFLFLSNA